MNALDLLIVVVVGSRRGLVGVEVGAIVVVVVVTSLELLIVLLLIIILAVAALGQASGGKSLSLELRQWMLRLLSPSTYRRVVDRLAPAGTTDNEFVIGVFLVVVVLDGGLLGGSGSGRLALALVEHRGGLGLSLVVAVGLGPVSCEYYCCTCIQVVLGADFKRGKAHLYSGGGVVCSFLGRSLRLDLSSPYPLCRLACPPSRVATRPDS